MNNYYKNFVAGEWKDAITKIEVTNPETGEIFANVAEANFSDVEEVIDAARKCVDSGILTKDRPKERTRLLLKIAKNIRQIGISEGAELLSKENGKSIADAQDEFDTAARYFEYYAGMADKIEGKSIPLGDGYIDFTIYEPIGVSLQIVPWNFPVDICARSLAPALAAGNAVIIKSPEITPLAITLIAKACQQAGLTNGALSILCGLGSTIGNALVSTPDIDQIVFTGSVETGKHILKTAAENATPCIMELGGKSAAVVFEDADINQFVASVAWGIYFNAGQICSAMSRIIVERSIYQKVINAVVNLSKKVQLGTHSEVKFTPLTSELQYQRVLDKIKLAKSQGAELVYGGNAVAEKEGYYIEPTVFKNVSPDSDLFLNEVFGPVVAILPFDTEQQTFELANATDYGLVSGVFTNDLSRALRASRSLKSGQVFVNEWFAGGVETPFGGIKMSGFGREKGQEALYSYVNTKNIAIKVNTIHD
ncbi:MAG: aldehyde dehydrogenase family protein [Kangiellaceae bacterium]